jgi:Helix-turn-helix domain
VVPASGPMAFTRRTRQLSPTQGVASHRERSGLSQRGLARAVRISAAYASELEHGRHRRKGPDDAITWEPVHPREPSIASSRRYVPRQRTVTSYTGWLALNHRLGRQGRR